MGEVYRARDSQLNRDVAIKVLLPAERRLERVDRQVFVKLSHAFQR